MKFIFLFLLLTPLLSGAEEHQRVAQQTRAATVLIRTPYSISSGFFISPNTILTARHNLEVIEKRFSWFRLRQTSSPIETWDLSVQDAEGRRHLVKSVISHDTLDAALLILEDDVNDISPLRLSIPASPVIGDRLICISSELAHRPDESMIQGTLVHTNTPIDYSKGVRRAGYRKAEHAFVATGEIYSGISGSPVVNDSGALIGIAVAALVEENLFMVLTVQEMIGMGPAASNPATDADPQCGSQADCRQSCGTHKLSHVLQSYLAPQ